MSYEQGAYDSYDYGVEGRQSSPVCNLTLSLLFVDPPKISRLHDRSPVTDAEVREFVSFMGFTVGPKIDPQSSDLALDIQIQQLQARLANVQREVGEDLRAENEALKRENAEYKKWHAKNPEGKERIHLLEIDDD